MKRSAGTLTTLIPTGAPLAQRARLSNEEVEPQQQQPAEQTTERERMLDRLRTRLHVLANDDIGGNVRGQQEGHNNLLLDSAIFSVRDASLTAADMQHLRRCLDHFGIVVGVDALNDAEVTESKRRIGECMVEMAGEHMPEQVRIALRNGNLYAANAYRNSKSGLGNCSFGYLFKNWTATSDAVQVGDDQTYVCELPTYHRVLMHLMTHNAPRRTAVMLALTGAAYGGHMLSCDSVKVAGGDPKGLHQRSCLDESVHKGTKQVATKPHMDVYPGTDRAQVLLNWDVDALKLCFVFFSHDAEVQRCLEFFQPGLRNAQGFYSVERLMNQDDVWQVLRHYTFAPPKGAMVVWKSGVIHFEAKCHEPRPGMLHYPLHQVEATIKDDAKARRLRWVVGTHRVVNWNDAERKQWAVAATHDVVPDMYKQRNKGKRAFSNIVCAKGTQAPPRSLGAAEKQRLLDTKAIVEDEARVEREFEALSALEKHMYGVAQPIATLGFDDQTTALLRRQVE